MSRISKLASISLLFFLLATECEQQYRKLPKTVYGEWRHAHEEDTPEEKIYRPAAYPFQLSRERNGFTVLKKGKFIHYQIGPSDKPERTPATWIQTGDRQVTVFFPNDTTRNYQLEFLEITGELLKVKK